ncbi:MAG: hypothetical protein ACI8Q9_000536 [Planctomycetota bacterium]|jgi:hypothetical protein
MPGTKQLPPIKSVGTMQAMSSLTVFALLLPLIPQEPVPQYSRDIRPLLADKCFVCHGPDETTRDSGMRLDTFAFATEDLGGYAAIVPGDLEASELWYRVQAEDPEELMPPLASHRAAFTEAELARIQRWIESGAEYEEHWAFVPPTQDSEYVGLGAIDGYIGAELKAHGLSPSPRADAAILVRRLMLDVTGLPPTPSEVAGFSAAYAVDPEGTWNTWTLRLLTEEPYVSRYAERMTTPWLDQARYGDTSGIHTDAGRQIWPWRDWVLEAYRNNMPFDQFLTEQLAGDLLPDATTGQIIASGFNRNHIITDEGGAIDEEALAEYSVDRVSTTGEVFLGLTTACARCHDHKFDPTTQEDFYRFYSFFSSIDEPGLYSQQPNPNRAFEPFLEVPSEEQLAERAILATKLADGRSALSEPSADEQAAFDSFLQDLPGELDLTWVDYEITDTESTGGADLVPQEDGSVLASGANPAVDVHQFTLHTNAVDMRLLQLDVLRDETFVNGAPGRADNGNAVLTSFVMEAVSTLDPSVRKTIDVSWAWASFAQTNDDWGIQRAFDNRPNKGWAIAGHTEGGGRTALFLASEPFGFEGGTTVEISLGYESIWAAHSFGRVRFGLGKLDPGAIDRIPLAGGRWYETGAFPVADASVAYDGAFGPELDGTLDPAVDFDTTGAPGRMWTYREAYLDGQVNPLAAGVNVHYVAKELWSPDARELEVSLGSDDGFALFVNGKLVSSKQAPRGAAPDQDRATINLLPGRNTIVFKVINTGGQAGFYFKALEAEQALTGGLVAGLLQRTEGEIATAQETTADQAILHSWRLAYSPTYKSILEIEAGLIAAQMELEAAVPRTMVMRERDEPRPTFVLIRGEYDQPDKTRPVEPGVPRYLSGFGAEHLPTDRRATRLDLANWMTDPENPLVARVAVNRIWQVLFGTGLVTSSGDFGLQGAWPSHPELLDHLAVGFVEDGWNVKNLIHRILISETYRQSSHMDDELAALDPGGALLGRYPARRLTGEAIRDGALYAAGLLEEKLGGPSVKPYQPAGLWSEVSMPASNTGKFEVGTGQELYRRSVYTYWKRAAPPPSMLTFDAPSRESCTVMRGSTNTPLQALVLWNDEQFVEAARNLAMRGLGMPKEQGLRALFLRCTGAEPDTEELALLGATLDALIVRYEGAPEDASALISVGMGAMPSAEELRELGSTTGELAAWTLVASAVLNLHATITQR